MIVNVRLFGMLGILADQRSIALDMPGSATLGDVLAELGRRLGKEFSDRIFRVPGEIHSYCQVFLDGAQVSELGAKLKGGESPKEVGIILLTASEGG